LLRLADISWPERQVRFGPEGGIARPLEMKEAAN
jgi:hypothetical protein